MSQKLVIATLSLRGIPCGSDKNFLHMSFFSVFAVQSLINYPDGTICYALSSYMVWDTFYNYMRLDI